MKSHNHKQKNKIQKDKDSKQKTSKKSKNNSIDKISNILVKLFLLLFLLSIFFYMYNSYSNTISLLAVSENSQGKIISGNIITLNLKIVPGTGKIYTNLDTLTEIDTQVSVVNSVKTVCKLFSLDCKDYDLYFNFNGSSAVLKGPSASAAIGIITAKTLMKEKLNKSVVITGALSSGGIIGNVGGIKEKIKIAEKKHFSHVLIPAFSNYNLSEIKNSKIKVTKVLDIVEAFNYFSKEKIVKEKKINFSRYKEYRDSMKSLSMVLCSRSKELLNRINSLNYNKNNSLNSNKSIYYNLYKDAKDNINASNKAILLKDYYSAGSFCYSANINLQKILLNKKNLSLNSFTNLVKHLQEYLLKSKYSFEKNTKGQIKNLNDLYIYMIVLDRTDEAINYITRINKDLKEINRLDKQINYIKNFNCSSCLNNLNKTENKVNSSKSSTQINLNCSQICLNKNFNSSKNFTLKNPFSDKITKTKLITDISNRKKLILNSAISEFAFAFERNKTIKLWSSLFGKIKGKKIVINKEQLSLTCFKILKINIYNNELLNQYGIKIFNKEINKYSRYQSFLENDFSDYALCIYKGLELNGKISSVLNSNGVTNNQSMVLKQFLNITEQRISLYAEEFPLISYIYYEYGKNLIQEKSYNSAFLYLNYALTFNDLNIYFKEQNHLDYKQFINSVLEEFSANTFYAKIIFGLLGVLILFS